MDREILEERATDYAKGVKRGYEVAYAEVETREQAAYDTGFREGMRHCGRVQWMRLFWVVLAAGVITLLIGATLANL